MKKTRLLLVLALFCFALNEAVGQNPQWDVYNNIPNFKSISFAFSDSDVEVGYKLWNDAQPIRQKRNDGKKLFMAIHDNYSVELRYTSAMRFCEDKEIIPISIYGSGIIRWQNEGMVLDLNVNVRSQGGSDGLCSQYQSTRYGDVYSTDTYTFPYFDKTTKYSYSIMYDERGFFVLSGSDISSTIEGNDDYYSDDGNSRNGIPVLYKTLIKLTGKAIRFSVSEKSQSEMNAQNSDMYGKWQWNNERSVIYLESTTKDAHLVLWNNDDNLLWGFQLSNIATGYKTETTDSGQDLAYLMLSFDGASEQSFSFVKTGNNFVYAQYDRFLGSLKHDASIINQIKDKRTLILNYKQNGSDKTVMFQLEGLEAIYNAITQ